MAASGSSEDTSPPTFVTEPKAKAKRRRRQSKREGPLQLQFLTATDPSQFKDANAKRSVRSQAMRHYRNTSEAQKKEPEPESLPSSSYSNVPARQASTVFDNFQPFAPLQPERYVSPETDSSQTSEEYQDQQYLHTSTSEAGWGAKSSVKQHVFDEELERKDSATQVSSYDTRYGKAFAIRAPSKVVKYEDSDSHEESQMRMLIGGMARFFNINDGVDPFVVLPQFKSPELDSVFLMRKCMRAFASDQTIKKWLPAMLAHPHIILSSTLLTSTLLDMYAGVSGDSKRTAMVKGETIEMINTRLRSQTMQLDNETLIVILHLFAGEMWSCDERTLRIHESGVARFVMQRGGMRQLLNNPIGEVAAACCYHCDIFCESKPLPAIQSWQPPKNFTNIPGPFPESPLFCPKVEFSNNLAEDRRCSIYTYGLLCDMRDLTNLFIQHHAQRDAVHDVESEEAARLSSLQVDYDIRVSEIRERLASLPSAYTAGLPTSNDWIYEACRIAALIYTASIIMRVPFSIAADPARNPLLSAIRSFSRSRVGGHTVRLNDALYEVVQRTDTANLWDNLSGVLYWVTAVGAAASRTPLTVKMMNQPSFREESYMVWVRRCLIMFSTRTMIVLIFQHPIPIILAQRKLLKVQALIGRGTPEQSRSLGSGSRRFLLPTG